LIGAVPPCPKPAGLRPRRSALPPLCPPLKQLSLPGQDATKVIGPKSRRPDLQSESPGGDLEELIQLTREPAPAPHAHSRDVLIARASMRFSNPCQGLLLSVRKAPLQPIAKNRFHRTGQTDQGIEPKGRSSLRDRFENAGKLVIIVPGSWVPRSLRRAPLPRQGLPSPPCVSLLQGLGSGLRTSSTIQRGGDDSAGIARPLPTGIQSGHLGVLQSLL
jgi:hypothetical protein